MSSRQLEQDELFMDIVAWGKGIALAAGEERLDLQHLLLWALKTTEGRRLLSEFLRSEGPLKPESLGEPFQSRLEAACAPVTDRTLGLAPRLMKITDQVCARQGKLSGEAVLKRVLEALAADPEWGRPLLSTSRLHPLPPGFDTLERIERALDRLSELRAALRSRVIGQDRAIDQVCDAYFPVLLGADADEAESAAPGPRVIFTFAGPPGVGKTLLAETMAESLGDGERSPGVLRLDMTAYSTHQAHEQLVGFSKAYSGASRGILAGFIEEHPEGFVLVDEVEKAHRNTQNLFLQILDSGRLYDNHTRSEVDFRRATLVFTTNLGRELYDAPNRSGVLQEARNLSRTVLEALGREGRRQENSEGAGLPPALVSRLSKGTAILFQRLDGLALERIADLTFREVSDEIRAKTGLSLDFSEPKVLTLFILRFAPGGDARRLTAGLRSFLYATLSDVLGGQRKALLGANSPLLLGARGFRFMLEAPEALPEAVKRSFEGETRLLLIDDDEWTSSMPSGITSSRVTDRASADEALRAGGVDLVLLDLHIGAPAGSSERGQGLGILHWLRARYPSVPVYLFSEFPEERGLSSELLEQVSLEGGARGVLQKKFYGSDEESALERDSFFRQLGEIDSALRRQRLVEHYRRRAKVIEFDVSLNPAPAGPEGFLTLEVGRVREVTAVSAMDMGGTGWVGLPRERFADVAGAERAKERLGEVVRWLTDPAPLRRMGIEAPKGILLTGPPGTGKTTLARAVAGEADAPFFAISGSEVFSKWVGESAANIRELFACARRYAPSVIFIDEIDSLGRQRGRDPTSASGAHVAANALNELLAQMDGFRQEENPVFVLAATNRPDVLDPALLRAGRFDLQIEVPRPSPPAREALFRIHSKALALGDDVDLAALVRRTAGLSGADIRQVCKEAALIALRRGRRAVSQADLQEAVTDVRMGLASEAVILEETARWATAVHEAGHALAHHLLFPDEPVAQVSILPRGRALGFSESSAPEGYRDPTRSRLRRRIQVLVAGRAAEGLVLGRDHVTGGCASDLDRATALAVQAVASYGLDEKFWILSIEGLRRGLGESGRGGGSRPFEEEAAARVKAWLEEALSRTLELLEAERGLLEGLARELLARETLYAEDLRALLSPGSAGPQA